MTSRWRILYIKRIRSFDLTINMIYKKNKDNKSFR